MASEEDTVHRGHDLHSPSEADVNSAWRSFDYKKLVVPLSVTSAAAEVKPHQDKVTVNDLEVFYREAKPPEASPHVSVLLLHGMAFTSETWQNLGTIGTLAQMGYRVVAVDIPGYGNSPAGTIGDPAEFVSQLLSKLQLRNPVVVSPSMSGRLSIPFLVRHAGSLSGYVPVAPVGYDVLLRDHLPTPKGAGVERSDVYTPLQAHLPTQIPNLSGIEVPTLVVFGEHDRSTSSAVLNLLPNSVAAEIPHARHPAYLDNPTLWHQMLYNFLLRLCYVAQQKAATKG